MAEFKSTEWKRAWGRRPVWTPSQLADIATGRDPAKPHRNIELYNCVIEEIMLSVRVKHSTLPTVDDLRWPETADETIYRAMPLLKPAAAYSWAAKRWPETIISFSPDDFVSPDQDVPERLRPFVSGLIAAWKAEAGTSSKELADLIAKKTGVPFRAAESIVASIRPKRSARPR